MINFARRILVPAAATAFTLIASVASAQTFTNSANVAIPFFGPASPYASQINVVGGPTSIGSMTVTLAGFSHGFPKDVGIMLVGPNGASTILFGRAGGGDDAVNVTPTFRDGAPPISTAISSRDFAPTRNGALAQTFTFPAPATPTTTALSSFANTNANGTWSLYVQDFVELDNGAIAGGWSISFYPGPIAPASQDSSFTYQGRLDSGAVAVNGTADFRFSLWPVATNAAPAGQIGNAITRTAVPVTNGLFTTSLDFGFGVLDNKNLFLQIEVRSPAGIGALETLTPRQPMTAAINAQFARSATSAVHATNATSAVNMPWSGLTGQAQVQTGAIGSGWQLFLTNTANVNFRGGMRQADNGFLEVTSSANLGFPNFARLNNAGSWSAVSDARLKTDISDAEGNLAAAMKLHPVNFRWKASGVEDFGLIAQDVRGVIPQLVTGDERAGMLTVNYSQLSVVAIGAIQELKAENDQLKARLEKIEVLLSTQAAK